MSPHFKLRITSAALAATVAATMAVGLGGSVASAYPLDRGTPRIVKSIDTTAGTLTANVK